MFLIDSADATGSEPTRPAAGTPAYFSNSNETIVPDWWLNMMQKEPAYVVTQNGLTLDKTDDTQLYQALQAMFKSTQNPFNKHACFLYEEASGSNGVSLTTATWTKVPIATTVVDDIGLSLSSSTLTLVPGTYRTNFTVGVGSDNRTSYIKSRLRNTTAGTSPVIGMAAIGENPDGIGPTLGISRGTGQFTIASTSSIELQVYGVSNYPLHIGYAVVDGVENEVYAQLEMWKVA